MSEVLGANGNELTITIPSSGERDWATSIRDNCFQKISDHSHEGSGLGKKLRGYLAIDQTEAILANNTTLKARDNAGSATIDVLKVTTGDEVEISTTVASADFQDDGFTVSDNANNTKKLALQLSGITAGNTRTLTMADEDVDLAALKNSNISASAAIALSKLAAVTVSRALVSDGSGFVSASTVTATELGYVSGVTSDIQTQIDALPDTGTANEITLTGTAIGLADNPVIPGTDSMVVPSGTTAQRVSTTDGAFRFNSTLNRFEGYKSSAWSEVGGGGGGLDIFHDEDFAVTAASDFTTGQNATPDAVGTGTLGGTLGEESSTQLAGTKSLKFTMNATAASSDNDFFLNDADITLDVKQQANFLGIDFYYTYDGSDDDIRFFVLDDSDNELTLSNEYLKSASTATRFSTSIYVGSAVTGIRYGFQVVSGNSSKVLLIDDVQITTNPFVYKNLITDVRSVGKRSSSISATSTATAFDLEAIEGDLTLSSGAILIEKTGRYTVENSVQCYGNNETYTIGYDLNGTITQGGTRQLSNNSNGTVQENKESWILDLKAGDLLKPAYYISVARSWDEARLTVSAVIESEHVITPAKSTVEVYDAHTYAGRGSTNTHIPYFSTVTTNTTSELGTVANDSTDGWSFTATKKCRVFMSFSSGADSTNARNIGISLNSSQLTTDVQSINAADRKALEANVASAAACASAVIELNPGDVIRPHMQAITPSTTGQTTINLIVHASEVTFLAAVPTNVQNNATDYTTESGITIEGTTSNPTKAVSPEQDEIVWAQHGQNLKAYYKYGTSSLPLGGGSGSGDYLFTLPNGLSFDSNVVDYYTTVEGAGIWKTTAGMIVGHGVVCVDISGEFDVVAVPYDATRFRLFLSNDSSSYSGAMGGLLADMDNVYTIALQIDAPIDGWTSAGTFLSATPKPETCYIKDVKASGTSGGTFTNGAWQTRDLNDLSGDTSWVSLSSNQFTLDAGKYEIEVEAPAYSVINHVAKLYNITDAADHAMGSVEYASQTYQGHTKSSIKCNVNISSSKTFEVQHQCYATISTNGFGVAASYGDEIYTQVKITKIP